MKKIDFFMSFLIGTNMAGLLTLVLDIMSSKVVVILYVMSCVFSVISYYIILKYEKKEQNLHIAPKDNRELEHPANG